MTNKICTTLSHMALKLTNGCHLFGAKKHEPEGRGPLNTQEKDIQCLSILRKNNLKKHIDNLKVILVNTRRYLDVDSTFFMNVKDVKTMLCGWNLR